MNTNDNSAESLIEILTLCEKTLAAFEASNGTNDPHPVPVKARVPASRRRRHMDRRFSLIRGGLDQQNDEPTSR